MIFCNLKIWKKQNNSYVDTPDLSQAVLANLSFAVAHMYPHWLMQGDSLSPLAKLYCYITSKRQIQLLKFDQIKSFDLCVSYIIRKETLIFWRTNIRIIDYVINENVLWWWWNNLLVTQNGGRWIGEIGCV